MEQMKDNRVDVDAIESTVHLHWSGLADLDLMALVCQGNAEYHLISFANEGSSEHSPFVELVSDITFEVMPTSNQEIVRVHAQKIESPNHVWFFCWDFRHVEAQSDAPFSEYEVSLELRQPNRFIRTSTIESDSGTGNTICLARWDMNPTADEDQSVLVEVNHPFSIPLMEGMSEVCKHLIDWTAEHQNV